MGLKHIQGVKTIHISGDLHGRIVAEAEKKGNQKIYVFVESLLELGLSQSAPVTRKLK